MNDDLREVYKKRLEELEEADVSLVPSKGMQSAAKRGLELYEKGRGGDGLVAATIRDARKMARGEALSASKVKRMRAWFARHYVDKKPGWSDAGKETPGYVAHLLWGGDAGRSWSNKKVKQMESRAKMQESDDQYHSGKYSLRQIAMIEMYDEIAESLGKWDLSHGSEGAHYMGADDNPFAKAGMACVNCAAFRGGGYCEWVSGEVEPNAVCKLWVISNDNLEMADGGESSHGEMSEAIRSEDEKARGEDFDPFRTSETD